MSIHQYGTDVVRTHLFRCDHSPGIGVPAEDLYKALAAAEKKYREIFKLIDSESIPGDALQIFGSGEDVTVFFKEPLKEER